MDDSWAWAAGLFDGEGCIHQGEGFDETRGRRWWKRSLMLQMCDEDVVRRFHEFVAAGSIRLREYGGVRQDAWFWYCTRWPDIERILNGLLPYLGVRRRAAAEALLANPPKYVHGASHCHRGHEFTPENTRVYNGLRHCLACGRIRTQAYRDQNRDKLKAYNREYYLRNKTQV